MRATVIVPQYVQPMRCVKAKCVVEISSHFLFLFFEKHKLYNNNYHTKGGRMEGKHKQGDSGTSFPVSGYAVRISNLDLDCCNITILLTLCLLFEYQSYHYPFEVSVPCLHSACYRQLLCPIPPRRLSK